MADIQSIDQLIGRVICQRCGIVGRQRQVGHHQIFGNQHTNRCHVEIDLQCTDCYYPFRLRIPWEMWERWQPQVPEPELQPRNLEWTEEELATIRKMAAHAARLATENPNGNQYGHLRELGERLTYE